MKFTLSWLKEHLETNCSLDEIASTLTAIGLEVEEITDLSKALSGFIIAEIKHADQHPNADKLRICKVDNGVEILQIVCGAANAREGIKVVLAPVGITIPNGNFKIKASKIRDVESNGMLCSYDELGLSGESEGIIELEEDAAIGLQFVDYAGLADPVIEIAVTPNRGDCLGVRGIARDLAAAGLGKLKPLSYQKVEEEYLSPVKVEIKELSDIFAGRYFKGVKNCKSPKWLENRLVAIGLRPISALVDITNYISYEFARPLHVYDADKLTGNIIVRSAKSGEKLDTLANQELELAENMAVIADDSGAIGLAGIIGGASTSCELESHNIFLEAALFDAENIAITGRKLGVNSDARYRFERSVDPEFVLEGVEIASRMIIDICGGTASELVIAGEAPKNHSVIDFSLAKCEKISGIAISKDAIINILTALECKLEDNGEILRVTTPSFRHDLKIEHDLVEEIIRIYGYDNIPLQKISYDSPSISESLEKIRKIRLNIVNRGLKEVISWSFISEKAANNFGGYNNNFKLINPISKEMAVMRKSILPGLLEMILKNDARSFADINIFEIGRIYLETDNQPVVAAGMRGGNIIPRNHHSPTRAVDFYDVKADIFAILESLGFDPEKMTLDPANIPYYHPGKSAILRMGSNIIAQFGEIHPKIKNKINLVAFEIFLENIPNSKSKKGKFDISDLQKITRDFAFIVDENITCQEIIKAVKSAEKNLLKKAEIFDIYVGKNIDPGKKSIGVSITLLPKEKNLEMSDIEAISNKVIENVTKATGAVLRI